MEEFSKRYSQKWRSGTNIRGFRGLAPNWMHVAVDIQNVYLAKVSQKNIFKQFIRKCFLNKNGNIANSVQSRYLIT